MIERLSPNPWRIRTYPDDLGLRLVANEVTDYNQQWLSKLIVTMGSIMHQAGGLGLAAPQVGVSSRVIVFRDMDEPKRKQKKPSSQLSCFAMVNPRIVDHSEETGRSEEGCLSIPGLNVTIDRWEHVVVEHETAAGDTFTVEAGGRQSYVLQHEVDHLDGVLLIDRLEFPLRRQMISELALMREHQREAQRQQLMQALGASGFTPEVAPAALSG